LYLFPHFNRAIAIKGPAASTQVRTDAKKCCKKRFVQKVIGRQPASFVGQLPAIKNGKAADLLFFVSDPRAALGLQARVQSSLFAPAS
jgi:hypothetical protein